MAGQLAPYRRPLKLFDGNTAHSTGYFWTMVRGGEGLLLLLRIQISNFKNSKAMLHAAQDADANHPATQAGAHHTHTPRRLLSPPTILLPTCNQ